MIRVLIRRRPDREHLLLYYVDPATGKEVCHSAGTSDRGEAERKAGAWESELLAFRGPHGDGWDYFIDRFGDEHLATLAPNSRGGYRTALAHYRRIMAADRLADVTTGSLSTFQEKLLREGVPLTTLAKHLTHLRTALNWAEYVGLIRKAPIVRLPKIPKRSLMRGRPLTEKEFASMLAAAAKVDEDQAAELRRLLTLLWHSGLRLTEALALDWQAPPVLVQLATHPPQIIFFAEGQKSRKDEALPITPELAEFLARLPRSRRQGPVIRLKTGRDRFAASRLVSACGATAGVWIEQAGKKRKPASAHDLRRSFGTRLAGRVRPVTLQKLMRHATLETTLRYYVSLSAADAAEELWAGRAPRKDPKKDVRTGQRAAATPRKTR